MIKIFYEDKQWFAFEAPYEQDYDKAAALPVLNPEILERVTIETCPIVDSRVPILAWPGTMQLSPGGEVIDGYILHLPNKDIQQMSVLQRIEKLQEWEHIGVIITTGNTNSGGLAKFLTTLKDEYCRENSAHSYTEGAEIIESLKSENARLRQAYDYILASRNSVDKELAEANEQNESLKQSLRELIPIAEKAIVGYSSLMRHKQEAAIDRAKSKLK